MSSLADDDKVYRYNGAAWVQIGESPGLVLVSASTLTTVASVSLNDIFTSAYENYLGLLFITTVTPGTLTFRLRVGGVDATGANYNQQRLTHASTTVTGAAATGATSWMGQNPAVTLNSMVINFFRPAVAASTGVRASTIRSSATDLDALEFYLGHDAATAYDGFSFILSSGSMTGSLRVYGYKN